MKISTCALVALASASATVGIAGEPQGADAYLLRGLSAFGNDASTSNFLSIQSTEWQDGAYYQLYGQWGGVSFNCGRNFSESVGMLSVTPSRGVLTLDAAWLAESQCYYGGLPMTSLVLSCAPDDEYRYETYGTFRYTFGGELLEHGNSIQKELSAQCRLTLDAVEWPADLRGSIRLLQGVRRSPQ
jgi:hypothetical protein